MNYYLSRKVLLLSLLLYPAQNAYSMFESPDDFNDNCPVCSHSIAKSKDSFIHISSQIEEEPNATVLMILKKEFQEYFDSPTFIDLPTKTKLTVGAFTLGLGTWTAYLIWSYYVLWKE